MMKHQWTMTLSEMVFNPIGALYVAGLAKMWWMFFAGVWEGYREGWLK